MNGGVKTERGREGERGRTEQHVLVAALKRSDSVAGCGARFDFGTAAVSGRFPLLPKRATLAARHRRWPASGEAGASDARNVSEATLSLCPSTGLGAFSVPIRKALSPSTSLGACEVITKKALSLSKGLSKGSNAATGLDWSSGKGTSGCRISLREVAA